MKYKIYDILNKRLTVNQSWPNISLNDLDRGQEILLLQEENNEKDKRVTFEVNESLLLKKLSEEVEQRNCLRLQVEEMLEH